MIAIIFLWSWSNEIFLAIVSFYSFYLIFYLIIVVLVKYLFSRLKAAKILLQSSEYKKELCSNKFILKFSTRSTNTCNTTELSQDAGCSSAAAVRNIQIRRCPLQQHVQDCCYFVGANFKHKKRQTSGQSVWKFGKINSDPNKDINSLSFFLF